MDGISPIEAFLTGRLPEEEFLREVNRVVAEGSAADRTVLVSDWRTKSGRIRDNMTRQKLSELVQPIAWLLPGDIDPDGTRTFTNTMSALQPGAVLANRFVIETKIGSGGMSTVFKARDLRREEAQDRNPYVAVKTLNAEILQREDSVKILQREARKAQNLSHPNIVRIYDFDRDGSTLFITMELLEGKTLEQVIRDHGLLGASLAELLPVLVQVVSALQFAHAEGIVHSDLKPANIFVLPDGRVKVIDFGIARAIPKADASTAMRTTFDIHALGAMTPAYASPEMLEGQDPDPRDDVFALSCIVYEYLTGRHPFGRAPASMARAGNIRPQAPANLPARQWGALQAGLDLDRSKRTRTAGLLLSGLMDTASEAAGQRRMLVRRVAVPGVLVAAVAVGVAVYLLGGNNTVRHADEEVVVEARQNAVDDAARRAAQQRAAEAAAQQRAQQEAAQEAVKRQAEQRAAEEAARQQAQQQKAAEDAARQTAQQEAAEEAAKQQASAERQAQALADQVSEAQRRLVAMGVLAGSIDGKLGARTREAIRAFQLSEGSQDDGQISESLLARLHQSAPPANARARGLAKLAAEAGQAAHVADAIRLYTASVNLDPTNGDVLLALGDAYRADGNLDEARKYWSRASSSGGNSGVEAQRRLAGLIQEPRPAASSSPPLSNRPPQDQVARQGPEGSSSAPPAASDLHRSGACSVNLTSLRVGSVTPAPSMLVMTNDGGWCWFDSRYFVNTLRFAPTFRISQAPSHGQLVIGPDSSKEKTRVAYRPGAGFTGSDTFAVVDATLNLERRVQVTVTP